MEVAALASGKSETLEYGAGTKLLALAGGFQLLVTFFPKLLTNLLTLWKNSKCKCHDNTAC